MLFLTTNMLCRRQSVQLDAQAKLSAMSDEVARAKSAEGQLRAELARAKEDLAV